MIDRTKTAGHDFLLSLQLLSSNLSFIFLYIIADNIYKLRQSFCFSNRISSCRWFFFLSSSLLGHRFQLKTQFKVVVSSSLKIETVKLSGCDFQRSRQFFYRFSPFISLIEYSFQFLVVTNHFDPRRIINSSIKGSENLFVASLALPVLFKVNNSSVAFNMSHV